MLPIYLFMLRILFTNAHNLLKTHRTLSVHGMKSRPVYSKQLTLHVGGQVAVNQLETWWWNDEVDSAIKEKRRLWKEWQKGGEKEKYLQAKRKAKSAVHAARKSAQEAKFGDLTSNDQRNLIFKKARKMKNENQDIVGDKCVKDDNGYLAFDDNRNWMPGKVIMKNF